ncbi:MAG: chemotaxis protein CheD [Candidatus Omnitrophota bacterium]
MDAVNEITIGMADLKVGKAPQVLSTILGSCIGLCLYSPRHQTGGLLHLMMPFAGESVHQLNYKKAKYADTGVAELIHVLKKTCGVATPEIVAKMFGGAKVLKNVERNIGGENAEVVRSLLKEHGIVLKAVKVGGENGYRIKFHLDTGKVTCQIFGGQPEEF